MLLALLFSWVVLFHGVSSNSINEHMVIVGSHDAFADDTPDMCLPDESTVGIDDNNYEQIAVQCCFDHDDGTTTAERDAKKDGSYARCIQGVNYDTATQECANRDGRLCTAEEVRTDSVNGALTGCNHDLRHVWTSTDCTQYDICHTNPEPPCSGSAQPVGDADPDLTCGASNHPCTLPETYDATRDIKCDSTHSCPDKIYNLEHNIFCDGDSSCSGKEIHSKNDADCLDEKSYICCNGRESCRGDSNFLHSPDDDIYCGGYQSCYGSRITNTDDNIHCQGQEACAYATITACDDSVFCSGYKSCTHATITTFDDDISCCNTLSCSYAEMNVMKKVSCTSDQSCLHSTITFQENSATDQTLDCVEGNACDELIASCSNNIKPCTLILPSRQSYEFMFYVDRATALDDQTQINFYQYLTIRLQLELINRPPSNELDVLSLSSQPSTSNTACYYPQITISSNSVSIGYGCPGSITSESVTLLNDQTSFPVEYSIYVHIARDSRVTYKIGGVSSNPINEHMVIVGAYDAFADDTPDMCLPDESTIGIDDNNYEEIAVQCCFDHDDGTTTSERDAKKDGTSASCMQAVNYDTATQECANRNGRLCTAEEIRTDSVNGVGTGCNHDLRHVWTSTGCAESISIMSHFISSGYSSFSGGDKPDLCVKDSSTIGIENTGYNDIALQCCFDGANGVTSERDADVNGKSASCMQAIDFITAATECDTRGGRLCTIEEVHNELGKNSGCNHDYRHVWTSDLCIEAGEDPVCAVPPCFGQYTVNGGYDNNAIGNVYVYEDTNYFNVKQVIINSQPSYIAADVATNNVDVPSSVPSTPNNNVIYNNKYLNIFLFICIIFLFISLFSITIYNLNWKNNKKQKTIYHQVAVTDSETDLTVLTDVVTD